MRLSFQVGNWNWRKKTAKQAERFYFASVTTEYYETVFISLIFCVPLILPILGKAVNLLWIHFWIFIIDGNTNSINVFTVKIANLKHAIKLNSRRLSLRNAQKYRKKDSREWKRRRESQIFAVCHVSVGKLFTVFTQTNQIKNLSILYFIWSDKT